MKIYLARHGEYQNPGGIIPYRLPGFPLTELGRSQAQIQSQKLVNQNIRSLYTSPIERCVETATIIGKEIGLFPNQKDELIETGTPLQGLTKAEMEKLSPNYPYDVASHKDGGGESPEDLFNRMNEFVISLKQMSKSSVHVIVSHGDPISIFLIGTLTKKIPHLDQEFYQSPVRYIPMGGLVMLEYGKAEIPTYIEII